MSCSFSIALAFSAALQPFGPAAWKGCRQGGGNMIYLVVLSALYALHLLLKLHWITTVVIGGFLLLRISGHRKWYKKKIVYERKFEEVSEYLDMLLYAFVKEEKVERALVNVDAAMVDGPMRGVLQKAIDHMHMTFDETDVMRDSLQMIEREYACSRIKNVHDFIVHVEIYGGAIERPVELLLADKKRWEQRICGSMKERRKMFVDIVMSIAASLLICGMILYLPVMEIDISKNLISQVLTIVVVILDDLIFTRAQKYLAIDWLVLDGHTDEADAKKIEEYYRYDERKEKRLSVVLAVVTAAGAAAAYYFGHQFMTAAAMLLVALMANQHRVGRAVARKTLVRSIKCAFPGWLMDIVLLLQSENVQVALQKSQEHVPPVLRRDLDILVGQLEMEPESVLPYHRFLKSFQIPEVHSAMSMLFSVSMGNSGRADRQIGELIDRNLEMLDVAEKGRLKNLSSGMYLLFLAPVLTASLKLLVDMAVFMMTFLSGAGLG